MSEDMNTAKTMVASQLPAKLNVLDMVRDNIKNLIPYSSARHEFTGHASILLDANEKTKTNSGATATALVQTADGKTNTVTLKANGKESFMLNLNKGVKYNKAIITIKTGGKSASASFDLATKAAVKHAEGHKH